MDVKDFIIETMRFGAVIGTMICVGCFCAAMMAIIHIPA